MYRPVRGRMVMEDVKNKLSDYVNTGIRICRNRYNQEVG